MNWSFEVMPAFTHVTDQFMFGKEFLVCPVVRQHAQARKNSTSKNGPAAGEIFGTAGTIHRVKNLSMLQRLWKRFLCF